MGIFNIVTVSLFTNDLFYVSDKQLTGVFPRPQQCCALMLYVSSPQHFISPLSIAASPTACTLLLGEYGPGVQHISVVGL